jgi:hypothetical protein
MYFVLRVEVVRSLNLNLDQNGLNLEKIQKWKVNPIRVKG